MTREGVIGFGPDEDDGEASPAWVEPAEPVARARTSHRPWAALLALLALGWIAFAAWALLNDRADFVATAGAVAAPLALLSVAWLALRRDRPVAPLDGALEYRLSELVARLEAGREALSDQALHLSALGTETAAVLGRATATLREDGAVIEQQAGALSQLVAQLPQARAQTAEIAANLGQASGLEAQLAALGARSREADAAAAGAAQRVAAAEQAAAGLRDAVDTIGRSLATQDEVGRTLVAHLQAGMGEVEQRLERLDQSGTARTEQLSTALAALQSHADTLSAALARAGDAADSFIGRAEGLLTALDASAREIDETLPAALARLDGMAGASRERIGAMLPAVETVESGATAALDRLAQTERLLQQQREAIELFGQAAERQLTAGKRGAAELSETLDAAQGQMLAVADGAAPQLIDVMLRVRETATQAAERARETIERIAPQAAATIGHAADRALEEAIGGRVERQVDAVIAAAERAVAAANAAAALLQGEVARTTEGVAALEARVNESGRESFARRASLLMEALNSTSIDVSKLLSNDVTDTAWEAYLKGDRGVFTRRAVRLLGTADARAVLSAYEGDPEFREQVGRYIADFEAMLRQVLATRDGTPIAVTLLSSDMGKLYVALAQAIERLRA